MKTRFSNLYIKNLYDFNDTIIIKNANNVVDFVKNNLNIQEETQEILYCLCLNTKANVVNIFERWKINMIENKLIITNNEKRALIVTIYSQLEHLKENGRDKEEEETRLFLIEQLKNIIKKLEEV